MGDLSNTFPVIFSRCENTYKRELTYWIFPFLEEIILPGFILHNIRDLVKPANYGYRAFILPSQSSAFAFFRFILQATLIGTSAVKIANSRKRTPQGGDPQQYNTRSLTF